ncbi:hypothetical protein NCLIV_007580 [Neospora caninum Liverpool]|uniref:Glycosyl hydrolase, family 31 protein n=1 Tax=Neospora caninum (strain Liverpool) TaxID=572307 RepID=F0V959_NEOCL|nr:hypothetical protein NCLIV_007580 [Neospora caninum Liverpool]CBZ50284.1 hypothetical protein NCLIV_007580 [Neospora caninum Liverpool]CEL64889.1 TPA: glycosyl hydrolase, family 31 protein [Neospora caninum Liverpool]|eukprot:XP_003880318.1 hypothetical protein NCLIV_007580 [Neospora caninum Liverpool]
MEKTARLWRHALSVGPASPLQFAAVAAAGKAEEGSFDAAFAFLARLLAALSFFPAGVRATCRAQAPPPGVSGRRGRALTVRRVLLFGVAWLLVLVLLSPTAFLPPSFFTLFALFSPFPCREDGLHAEPPTGVCPASRGVATRLDAKEGNMQFGPSARRASSGGVLSDLGRVFVQTRNARLRACAPPTAASGCLACARAPGALNDQRDASSSWPRLAFSFLPRATFTAAIERDKFKLSCTQASFCHRFLHWVDLFAKKLPRASISAPPLYSVDVKSLPAGSAPPSGDSGEEAGKEGPQEEPREDEGGGRGETGQEERGRGSLPTSLGGEKHEGANAREKEKEQVKKEKEGKKKAKKEKKRRGGARAPVTVLKFDVVRGSDGLRLEARLAVFMDGIVRLKMREKLNAQQLQREVEKAQGKTEGNAKEPEDVHANVFRLDERFRRYEGYIADILHLEEDPAEGTDQEAKVTYTWNATVVEFDAQPPMSAGARHGFPSSFQNARPQNRTRDDAGRACHAENVPAEASSPRTPGKPRDDGSRESRPAWKTLEERESSSAFATNLEEDGLPVRVVLQHSPFALRLYIHHKLVQEINEKQLLNWEAFLPVNSKKRTAAEAEGRQQLEERLHKDPGEMVPNALANSTSHVPPEQQEAEVARVAEAASAAGVDLREKLKGLRGIDWNIGEPLGDDLDEEREVINDIVMPLLHAGEIHDAVDLYRQGAMEEAFDRFLDSKPFGPTAIGVDVTFWGTSQVYGLFEHAAPFPLKSYTEPYRMYNLDVFNYELDSPFSMYGSIPFLLAIHTPAAASDGPPSRRGSVSRYSEDSERPTRRGSFGGGPATLEEERRLRSPLVTGFLFLNPTETWVKIKYDQGGEELPETFAGLNEEEEDELDAVLRRQKRARQKRYHSFASRESLDWEAIQQKRWKNKYDPLRTWWTAEGGVFDVLMFLGPTPQDVHRQYHMATGLPAMAPLFALGKHQCRWNYNDQEDVLSVDRGFDEHNIPYDVIWIDIEHTLEKRYFTWDPKTFPSPQKMIEEIAAKGRKVVTIVDPHLKAVPDYYVYREALDKSLLVRNPSGGIFHGHCWSGDSAYADFLDPKTREWWAELFSYDRYKHSTPDLWIWNDMNEPSVFSGPELSMPKDLLHMNGFVEHREIHNMYGHYHHRSTYEGLLRRGQGKQRPFLLTRSTYVGSHRFGFVWTGDNRAEWTHLAASIPMILSASVCGMSAIGADVDGFFADPSEELHIRWQQTGIFYPFYRAHAHMDTKRREPWLFSKTSVDLVREAVLVRYTLFAEYALKGDPVVRPLWWLSPLSSRFLQEQQAFLVGSDLSVHPVLRPMEEDQKDGFEMDIVLPRDDDNVWIDFFSGMPFFPSSSDEDTTVKYGVTMRNIPVFVRGGTILLTKERLKRSSMNMHHSPYTVHIYPSAADAEWVGGGVATGRVYVDDYNSFDYRQGKFVYEGFVYYPEARQEGPVEPGADTSGSARNTWILRSQSLPLQVDDSGEPLTGQLSDFPHREIERIVLWAVASPPTRVVVSREGPPRVEEETKLTEEEVEGSQQEEEVLFSSEKIEAAHHVSQTQRLGGKTFYRVDVKLPRVEVGRNDWHVEFTF